MGISADGFYTEDVYAHLRTAPLPKGRHGRAKGLRDAEKVLRMFDAAQPEAGQLKAMLTELAESAGHPDEESYDESYVASFAERVALALRMLDEASSRREARIADADAAARRAQLAREKGERDAERVRERAGAEAQRHEVEERRMRTAAENCARPSLHDARFVR